MMIKVSGLTILKQVQQLDALDVNYAGFVFDESSPNYIGDKIKRKELGSSDFDIKKVGIFRNSSYDSIIDVVEQYGLDLVQLDGDESPELCEQLMDEVEVIKTFRIKPGTSSSIDELIVDYDEFCDYYLFTGENDEKFDWSCLQKSKIEKPFFIGGNITLGDTPLLNAFKHPDFIGTDIDHGFESSPGNKDLIQIVQFKKALKK